MCTAIVKLRVQITHERSDFASNNCFGLNGRIHFNVHRDAYPRAYCYYIYIYIITKYGLTREVSIQYSVRFVPLRASSFEWCCVTVCVVYVT